MENTFLEELYSGYKHRKYNLNKRKIEEFIDSFFHFIFFLELNKCESKGEIKECLAQYEKQFEEILSSVMEGCPKGKCKALFNQFPRIYKLILLDLDEIFANDPAAQSKEEIIYAYPGFYAIAIYRFAHALHLQDVPLIPRIWTELAHSKTGIDIHPGAEIGSSFFIDHGTGIVIGETTYIGNNVKIYQNVTLGALAVSKEIANTKRHPTIEDCVTIYAGATILGGKTTIGKGSIIGGNVWITESIEPYSLVYYKDKTIIKRKDKSINAISFSI